MTILKACPIVMRYRADGLEILAFRHPQAGCQLVKGSVEEDERAEDAALRELKEEAGIEARIARPLGVSSEIADDQSWVFYLCAAGRLPDEWSHHCLDDGGHDFQFFWHQVDKSPGDDWHPVHAAALDFVKECLCGMEDEDR